MQLFYCPAIQENQYCLDPEESHHCANVLRKKPGDTITITDGQGHLYQAQIDTLTKQKCTFSVKSFEQTTRPAHQIHIGIAPTKSTERIEWFVEKAVEIGIDKITFIYSAYTERKHLNIGRIKKKSISAMKQSLRTYLPEIDPLLPLEEFVRKSIKYQNKYVAHMENQHTKHLADLASPSADNLVVIGPEGGFAEAEIALLKQSGFKTAKLGDHRLRTETAGLVACSVLNEINRS